jgi:hypothetical protein
MSLTTLEDFSDYTNKNEQIAYVLGFRKVVGMVVNGKEAARPQWKYPSGYQFLQVTNPVFECPDFTAIIEQSLKLHKFYRSYPKDWNK